MCAALLVSFHTVGQVISTDGANVSNEMHKAIVSALKQQKDGLGMRVLSVEDGQHVLSSANGRYIIKGTLQDLWDGVLKTGTLKETLPTLPEMLQPERFFIDLGNPDGEPVLVFMKSNCQMCDTLFAVLRDPLYRSKYHFKVILLSNDDASTLASHYVYCSTDKTMALESLLANPARQVSINPECLDGLTGLANKAALAMQVRALPMVHMRNQSLTIIGDPSAYL